MVPDGIDLGGLLLADAELARLYNDCRARHRALTEYLK